ncbi:kinesin-like protein Klp98A isoform X2 [Ischnura elegans]|uniref:kinesin-like protein Klp98A isoform X2 n=1 Tax=Ischnura elegans TaxID=197161 RepID=UPI001ED898C8|nr:kinesin-like protein Klp98A isoform X2 [Ischnura elegans]
MASVKVAVRVRPFNQREKDMDAKLIISMDGRKTRIENSKVGQVKDGGGGRAKYKDFTFDHSYWSFDARDSHYASQEKVFEDLGMEVVASAFEGYNACVFAYGQTGSGKTFTMMGSAESQGLIPRICKNLFGRMHTGKEQGASYRTEVSYLEIYNERVKDLLHRDETGHGLRVREHPRLGPYVQDLSRHLVSDYPNIQELMVRGNNHRTTASTNMNDVSSRSHAIFTLMFVQAGFAGGMPSETVSKVHLVDLAGSERADATGATGQRLKEGAHINKSLVTLGSVISALAELSSGCGAGDGLNAHRQIGSRSVFIPYRDSVLTWLLKDSLGGNSKTIMIAAVSPADCNYGETLSTLRYANRAKNIINKPTINEDPNVKLIRELRDEITKLRSLLGSEFTMESQPQMVAALHQKEAKEKELTEEWTEKWRETQQILHEQKTLGLRKSGVGVVLDSDRPHLVGIDDDLLSTGVTLYHLKEGETSIGSEDAEQKQDIVLNGAGVEPEHCSVVLRDGVGTLIPKGNAQCWVNTVLVDRPTRLSQGCIIVLGRTNMFRYNDPAEAAKMRKEGSRSHLNLSRLSLLSWSTSDLDWSTENLLTSGDDGEKTDDLEAQRATLLKEKEAFKREQAEKELDWEREQQEKKEALEIAQRELEEERQQMELEYQVQKRRLAEDWQRLERSQQDALQALQAREADLQRRKEDLVREREREKSRAESASKCVSTLKEEISGKWESMRALVVEKITELDDGGQRYPDQLVKWTQRRQLSRSLGELDEVGGHKSRRSHSSQLNRSWRRRSDPSLSCFHHCRSAKEERVCLDFERLRSFREMLAKQRQELAKLEGELQSKLKLFSTHSERVEKIGAEISAIETKQEEVKKLVSSEVSDSNKLETTKENLAQRTREQLENIASRKQSLTLELRSVHGCEEQGDSDRRGGDLSSQDTFHTATSECMPLDKSSSWDDERFTDASRCGSDSDECAAAKLAAEKEAGTRLEVKTAFPTEEKLNCWTGGDPLTSEDSITISALVIEGEDEAILKGCESKESEQRTVGPKILVVSGGDDSVLEAPPMPDSEEVRVNVLEITGAGRKCEGPAFAHGATPRSDEREQGEGQSGSPMDLRVEDSLDVQERVVEGGGGVEEEEGKDFSRADAVEHWSAEQEVGRGNMGPMQNGLGWKGKVCVERGTLDVAEGRNRVVDSRAAALNGDPLRGWNLPTDNGLTMIRAEEALEKLSCEVERQKALVLQSLHNNCDRDEINRQISVLQELQRHYVRLEFALESPVTSSPVRGQGHEGNREDCDSNISRQFASSHMRENRHQDQEGNMYSRSRQNSMHDSSYAFNGTHCSNSTLCSCVCNGECHLGARLPGTQSARNSFSETHTRSPSSPNLYRTLAFHGHHRLSYSNLNLGRSMSYSSSLLTPMSMDEADPTGSGCGVWVQIPSYHLRGSGTFTHYEYEVRVSMEGEAWTILRRYRQFRQMHLSLKAKYGSKVEKIPFPPRKIFGKNLESVAKTRRKLLEVYLRHLLSVCCQIESCPLFVCRENPSRLALFEFSSFFRVSIFDSGKYGTG